MTKEQDHGGATRISWLLHLSPSGKKQGMQEGLSGVVEVQALHISSEDIC